MASTAAVAAAAAAAAWDDADVEICNDDGFVHRRRKRPRATGSDDRPSSSTSRHPPDPDPKMEKRVRRARRKAALMSVKERYSKELAKWEELARTVEDLTSKGAGEKATGLVPSASIDAAAEASSLVEEFRLPIDELLLQVEIQEARIQKLSTMCDVMDSVCDAREAASMQSLFDLPVWAVNPRALLASLSD